MLTTAQRKVCVCRRAEGVANNEEGDIPGVGVGQDGIGVGLDGLAVGEDDRAAIVGFLLQIFPVVSREEFSNLSLRMMGWHSPIVAGRRAGQPCRLRDIHVRPGGLYPDP